MTSVATRDTMTDQPFVGPNGHLWIEGVDSVDLATRFGTPLFVVSEQQVRSNVRRFRAAFERHYPHVEVLFANKVFNNLAIRHLMNSEGVGGDCFGETELYLSLLAGTPKDSIVLNGSSKSDVELSMAIDAGVSIILDSLEDLDRVASRCPPSRRLRLGVRAKLPLHSLETTPLGSQHFGPGSLSHQSLDNKWGVTHDDLLAIGERVRDDDRFELHELHYHLGRVTTDVAAFACVARELVAWAAALRDATGIVTPCVNAGGGWAVGRPEGHGPHGEDDASTPSFDDYASTVAKAINHACRELDYPPPLLRLEPGRALVANAVTLLASVGTVKRHAGHKTWINVDTSTNHLPRVRTSDWYHHMVVADRPSAQADTHADVVGPLCVIDTLGRDRGLPRIRRGDVLAILDAGAYTESAAANFNGQPRPATVLVDQDRVSVITERERPSDIVRRYRVPPHLLAPR